MPERARGRSGCRRAKRCGHRAGARRHGVHLRTRRQPVRQACLRARTTAGDSTLGAGPARPLTRTRVMSVVLERNLLGAPTEEHQQVEIYSGVARLSRTVWASEVRLAGTSPAVAIMLCHPTANFLGHYALAGLAERGLGAIGFTTRYVGNDTSLIMENCLLDMGAMVSYLYKRGYGAVVLVGNSGGASIVPYYQAQARQPTITEPPGGGPDLTTASLRPVDAI